MTSISSLLPARREVRSSGYYERLRFEALVNVRDLGGHPTPNGRLTRRRSVFRADGVHRATEPDIAMLEGVGVRRVIDLRTPWERTDEGFFTPSHRRIDYRHVPLLDEVDSIKEITEGEPLVVSYLTMIEHRSGRIVEAIDAIVGTNGAAVFHCTAGKDRTGVVAALVLRSVGVPADRVIADYAKSERAMERLVAWYKANRPADTTGPVQDPAGDPIRQRLMGARPEWMATVLDTVERRYGGAERYLLASGATPGTLRQLRRRLLGED